MCQCHYVDFDVLLINTLFPRVREKGVCLTELLVGFSIFFAETYKPNTGYCIKIRTTGSTACYQRAAHTFVSSLVKGRLLLGKEPKCIFNT